MASRALAAFLDLPQEQRHLGPFRLIQPLGRGGFAPVWLAYEMFGGVTLRTAAVKLFSYGPEVVDERAKNPDPASASSARRDEILHEARILSRVEHPNVVRFYGLPTDEPRRIVGL